MAVLNRKKVGLPVGSVYIGRGSIWGNPFVMKSEADRDEVCDKYEQHLWEWVQRGQITLKQLLDLDGKDLVCYCAPLRCHGHTLEKAIQWAKRQ